MNNGKHEVLKLGSYAYACSAISRGDHHLQSPTSRLLLNPDRQGRSSTVPRNISG